MNKTVEEQINEYLNNIDIESYTEHYHDWLLDELKCEDFVDSGIIPSEVMDRLLKSYSRDKVYEYLIDACGVQYEPSECIQHGTIKWISSSEVEVCLEEFEDYDPEKINHYTSNGYAYIETDGHWAVMVEDPDLLDQRIGDLMEDIEEESLPNNVYSFTTGKLVA